MKFAPPFINGLLSFSFVSQRGVADRRLAHGWVKGEFPFPAAVCHPVPPLLVRITPFPPWKKRPLLRQAFWCGSESVLLMRVFLPPLSWPDFMPLRSSIPLTGMIPPFSDIFLFLVPCRPVIFVFPEKLMSVVVVGLSSPLFF